MDHLQKKYFTLKSQVGTKRHDFLASHKGRHGNLFGGPGRDTLVASGGHDLLHGGAGADVYAIATTDREQRRLARKGKHHVHSIMDFDPSEGDTLDLSHVVDNVKDLKFIGDKPYRGQRGVIRFLPNGYPEPPTTVEGNKKNRNFEGDLLKVSRLIEAGSQNSSSRSSTFRSRRHRKLLSRPMFRQSRRHRPHLHQRRQLFTLFPSRQMYLTQ